MDQHLIDQAPTYKAPRIKIFLFQAAYWITSILVVLIAVPLLLIPGRALLVRWLRFYAMLMTFWMDKIIGLKLEVRGRQNVPKGSCIIAAKHQSWGDGFCMFSLFHDLAFVTGDHLEKIPLVGHILRKMDAIVVKQCGGAASREQLMDKEMARAREAGRRILIYPEGRLVPVGYHGPYKKGVFHMYEAYGCPVVPVATNLGLYWPQDAWDLHAGTAVIEFLPTIPAGQNKDAFMAELQSSIEAASLALLPDDFALPENREWIYEEHNK